MAGTAAEKSRLQLLGKREPIETRQL